VCESNAQQQKGEESVTLPDAETQQELLEIYFAYVHPALPILHKKSFLEELRSGCVIYFPFSDDFSLSSRCP
jgi:hypothetical protein